MRGTSHAATSSGPSAMMLMLRAAHQGSRTARRRPCFLLALPQPAHTHINPLAACAPVHQWHKCMQRSRGGASLTFAWRVGVAEQQLSCDHARRHYVHAHPAAAAAFCCCCCRHLGGE